MTVKVIEVVNITITLVTKLLRGDPLPNGIQSWWPASVFSCVLIATVYVAYWHPTAQNSHSAGFFLHISWET